MTHRPEAEQDRGGRAERGETQRAGIEDGDDRDRAEIVGDGDRGQEQFERGGNAAARERKHGDRESDVGRRRDRPAARQQRVGARDGEIEDGRHRHARRRREHRQPPFLPARQLALDELAFDLQPDQQEKEGHQPVVDPEMDRHRPELRREHRPGGGMEEMAPGLAERAVGDQHRHRRRRHQQQAARRLIVEEMAQRRAGPAWFWDAFHRRSPLPETRGRIERKRQAIEMEHLS